MGGSPARVLAVVQRCLGVDTTKYPFLGWTERYNTRLDVCDDHALAFRYDRDVRWLVLG
jgi:hypothetical protein